jgi:hypothetical protein
MFLFLVPCLLMSGCHRGPVAKQVEPERRQGQELRSNASQTSGIGKFLSSAKWYEAFPLMNGCILALLLVWGLAKAVFCPAPMKEEEASQDAAVSRGARNS